MAVAHFVLLTYIFTFKWMEKCVRKVIEMEIYHINPLYRIHQPSGWYGNEPKICEKLDAFSCISSLSSDKKCNRDQLSPLAAEVVTSKISTPKPDFVSF